LPEQSKQVEVSLDAQVYILFVFAIDTQVLVSVNRLHHEQEKSSADEIVRHKNSSLYVTSLTISLFTRVCATEVEARLETENNSGCKQIYRSIVLAVVHCGMLAVGRKRPKTRTEAMTVPKT